MECLIKIFLFLGIVCHEATVGTIEAGARDEADEAVLVVDDGECAAVGGFKLLHHIGHGVAGIEQDRRLQHELAGIIFAIELAAEDDFAEGIDVENAEEGAFAVDHRKMDGLALGDYLHNLPELHVRGDERALFFDDRVKTQQRENGTVLVVREQLTGARETHGIDAVRLKGMDGEIGGCRDNHERDEEVITAREFCNEEDACERCVENAAHHARHAQKCVVRRWNVDAKRLELVPKGGKHKARNAAEEKAGRKRTAATATAVGGCGREDLDDENEDEIENEVFAASVEERVIHDAHGIGLLCRQKRGDGRVAFTIERRKEEDEKRKYAATKREFCTDALQFAEDLLKAVHHPCEIERKKTAGNAKDNGAWHALHHERIGQFEREHGICPGHGIGDAGGGETRDEEGQERSHREVDHQHFKREDQTGDGGFEDAGNGARCAAPDEEHERFVVEVEPSAERRADGRTRQNDGRLRTDATTETDGDSGSDDGRPAVVRADVALPARDGKKNLCDAVTDVVTHDELDEKSTKENADNGPYEEEPVCTRDVET